MNLPIRISSLLLAVMALGGCKKDSGVIENTASQKRAVNQILKPVITSISPMQGMVYSMVKITGSNFSPQIEGNMVTFRNRQAIINSATATELIVTIPGNAITGDVVVLSNDFTDTSATPFKVLKFAPDGQQNINLDGVTEAVISKTGAIYALKKSSQKFSQVIRYANGTSAILFNDAPEFENQQNYFDHDYKGLLTDKDGNVYFARNSMRHRLVNGVATYTLLRTNVVKINQQGHASLVAGGEPGAVDGNGAEAQFRYIETLTSDAAGNLYVADFGNSRLRKITPGQQVTTLSSSVKIKNMVISSTGDLYFHDNSRIYKVTAANRGVSVIGGPYPNGLQNMIFDDTGNLLVSDRSGIILINKANYASRVALPAVANSIAFDAAGKLYTFGVRSVNRYALK